MKNRVFVSISMLNFAISACALYLAFSLENRINDSRDRAEAERCRKIVVMMNANRKLLDIEPINPEPTNYAEVLEAIFATSKVFMKESGIGE